MSTHIKYLPAGDYDIRWVPERPARPAGPLPNLIPRTAKPFLPKSPQFPLPAPRGGVPIGAVVGAIGAGVAIVNIIDAWQPYKEKMPYKVYGPWYPAPGGDCGRRPGSPPYVAGSIPNTGAAWATYAGHITNCNSGQAANGHQRWPGAYETLTPATPAGNRSLVLEDTIRFTGTVGDTLTRARNDYWWWKDASGDGVATRISVRPTMPAVGIPRLGDPLDANVVRAMPGEPVAQPGRSPQPFEWTWDSAPPGSRPPGSSGSKPPRKGDKEKKVRSKNIGAVLFGILDAISENAEIIDSFYESLPDKVKDRWDCNRSAPFIDKAGQYGIDNADCKLQALYWNWNSIDAGTAIMNVAKNLTEDQIYGLLHRYLPPGAMQAMPPQTSKAWNRWVEAALELIFSGQ